MYTANSSILHSRNPYPLKLLLSLELSLKTYFSRIG